MRSLLALLLVLGTLTSAHAQGFAPTSSVSGGGSSSGGCDPSALSDGAVLFVASGACTGDATALKFLPSGGLDGSLLVGTNVVGAYPTSNALTLRGNLSLFYDYAHDPAGNAISFLTSNGPPSAPVASTNGDVLADIFFTGYAPSGAYQNAATIHVIVDAAPSGSRVPGRLSFTTSNTGAVDVERFSIDSAANVTIGPGAASVAPILFAYDDNGDGSNSPYIYIRNTAVGGYAGISFVGHTVSDAFASIEALGAAKAAALTLIADGTTGVNMTSFQGATGLTATRNSGSSGTVSMIVDGTGGTAGNAAILSLAAPTAVSAITAQADTGGATVEAYTNGNGIAKLSARTTSLTIAPKLNIFYGTGGSLSTYALIHDPVGIITEYRSPNDQVFTFSGTETVRFATTGVVTMQQLKTTGAATGKKIVCVDTATGTLYASSSGVACAN